MDVRAAPAHPRWVLATTILASSLGFIDGSVVNVGLPAIGHTFPSDADSLQWVINAYLLPLSALLLTGGAAGDRFGQRELLMLGTAVFVAASIGCMLAPSLPLLLAARLAQGVGAAMLMPNSLAILGSTFSGAAKGRAIGIWAAAGAAAGAVGPVLGGWLIDIGNWRDIFLINVPLALTAIFLAWRFVPAHVGTHGHVLDVRGAALATLALGLLTWALSVGSTQRGWTASASIAIAAAAVLAAWFVAVERRRGEGAMMPLVLFGSSSFVGLNLLTLFLYAALGELMVLLPYVLIRGGGYSGTQAGASLLPLPIVLSLLSPMMGALAGRIGARRLLILGPAIVAAGFLLALRVGTGTSYWTTVLPAIGAVSLGLACAVAPLTTAVMSAVGTGHTGVASGVNNAVARTGALVATALLGAVLTASGDGLIAAFHAAMVAGAAASIAASLCALAWIRDDRGH
jgi:EmrB/QacA subfamily drug resistance transporter